MSLFVDFLILNNKANFIKNEWLIKTGLTGSARKALHLQIILPMLNSHSYI